MNQNNVESLIAKSRGVADKAVKILRHDATFFIGVCMLCVFLSGVLQAALAGDPYFSWWVQASALVTYVLTLNLTYWIGFKDGVGSVVVHELKGEDEVEYAEYKRGGPDDPA
jgi:hypothetical protein